MSKQAKVTRGRRTIERRPWREPAAGSLANPAVPLPEWPDHRPPVGTSAGHGTDTRYHYRRDPCRCDQCKAAHTAKCGRKRT